MSASVAGRKIRVRGIVQGVGFRPFVYGLAIQNHLTGWVRNTSAGVEIELNGSPAGLDRFEATLRTQPPPLARIDEFSSEETPPNGYTAFQIFESQPQPGKFIPISPDVSICTDCQRELFDPSDRRYRYPFINCTNCGPRFTIIKDIPYDRPKTTMAGFPMCTQCEAEYHDPLDRRFHAQPTACPVCGPQVWLETITGRTDGDDAIRKARQLLQQGKILAIKGLGGFHLACDATNPVAVDTLRERKKRSAKPFALMAFDLHTISTHCAISAEEAVLLQSKQHPIVLLEKHPGSTIVDGVAPGQRSLGFMLPYTPLHMLLTEPETGFPAVLVMTSGNLSEEPIAYRDDEAHERLQGLADAWLLHDRPIHMRVDDSVVRVAFNAPYLLRRARGYAPDPLTLPFEMPSILATGAELKNTFCLTRDRYAFISHHIGDLENYETLRSFEEGIEHYQRLFRVQPGLVACDLHPDYLATRHAHALAENENLPLIEVQHHHAHLASCLLDNNWTSDQPVIGLCFDGTGLGVDRAIWGGEVLVGGYESYQRRFHLAYTPLPGGDAATRKPARFALAQLRAAGLDWEADLPPVAALCAEERNAVAAQIERSLNAPLTSSMGRLFDAASSLLGICQYATYEGQAAIELEMAADPHETGIYPLDIKGDAIDPAPLWQTMLTDWRTGVAVPVLAARFINSIAWVGLELCKQIRDEGGISTVALSGGVWQNQLLLTRGVTLLRNAGFTVLLHNLVPANDGGIALGQAAVAWKQQNK